MAVPNVKRIFGLSRSADREELGGTPPPMRVLYIDWQMFHYRAAVLTSLAALPGLELFGATGGVDRVGQVQSASVKMFEQHFELKGTRLGSTFLWLAWNHAHVNP